MTRLPITKTSFQKVFGVFKLARIRFFITMSRQSTVEPQRGTIDEQLFYEVADVQDDSVKLQWRLGLLQEEHEISVVEMMNLSRDVQDLQNSLKKVKDTLDSLPEHQVVDRRKFEAIKSWARTVIEQARATRKELNKLLGSRFASVRSSSFRSSSASSV